MRLDRVRFALPLLALAATGCGADHSTSTARPASTRTVDVTMVDNTFQPATLRVSKGETVTFRFANTGTVRHEGVVGDVATQQRHHEEMATTGTRHVDDQDDAHGDDGHDDDGHGGGGQSAVTVEPGATGELTHTFDAGGTTIIGCHEPGHWEAGMKLDVTIA